MLFILFLGCFFFFGFLVFVFSEYLRAKYWLGDCYYLIFICFVVVLFFGFLVFFIASLLLEA